jgi:hypothetical protein
VSDALALLALFGMCLIAGFGGGMAFAYAVSHKLTIKINAWVREMDEKLEHEALADESTSQKEEAG